MEVKCYNDQLHECTAEVMEEFNALKFVLCRDLKNEHHISLFPPKKTMHADYAQNTLRDIGEGAQFIGGGVCILNSLLNGGR